MRRKGTVDERWKRVTWTVGKGNLGQERIDMSVGHPLLERVGGELYRELADKAGKRAVLKQLERTVRGASIP